MDIMTMILTNKIFTYQGKLWQAIGSFDDGTVNIINSDDEVKSISRKELEQVLKGDAVA